MGATANNPSYLYGYIGADPKSSLEVYSGPSGGTRLGTENTGAGTWHHVVFAFYGNKGGFADNLRELYLDGALKLSDTTSNFSTGHGLKDFAIGSTLGGLGPFLGQIDEWAIYELGGLPDLAARQARVQSIAGHYAVAIPEPGSALLLGLGAVALVAVGRRKKGIR